MVFGTPPDRSLALNLCTQLPTFCAISTFETVGIGRLASALSPTGLGKAAVIQLGLADWQPAKTPFEPDCHYPALMDEAVCVRQSSDQKRE